MWGEVSGREDIFLGQTARKGIVTIIPVYLYFGSGPESKDLMQYRINTSDTGNIINNLWN